MKHMKHKRLTHSLAVVTVLAALMCAVAPAQAHRALPSDPMITSSLIWLSAVPPAYDRVSRRTLGCAA